MHPDEESELKQTLNTLISSSFSFSASSIRLRTSSLACLCLRSLSTWSKRLAHGAACGRLSKWKVCLAILNGSRCSMRLLMVSFDYVVAPGTSFPFRAKTVDVHWQSSATSTSIFTVKSPHVYVRLAGGVTELNRQGNWLTLYYE